MGKKFDNIVIASDLDGTYLGSGSVVLARNVERVRYFCENGGHFTFATGRLPMFMRKALPNAHELINLYAVTGNGTCLYDFKTERAVEEIFLDYDALLDVANFARAFSGNAGFRGCTRGGFVIHDIDNFYTNREYHYFPDFMEKQVLDVSLWRDLNIYKVNIMVEKEVLLELYPLLEEKFSDRVTVSRAGYSAIEIMPHGTSKAKMLQKYVKQQFGERVMLCTVGDYDNDLEMHSIADLPVCPSNANERVKSVCKTCLCSNNEGVVADLIDLLDRQLGNE